MYIISKITMNIRNVYYTMTPYCLDYFLRTEVDI